MGPAGSVDFEDLVRSSRGGYFVDPDFPAHETSIWTEGSRSGFGVIMHLPSKVSAWCLVLRHLGEVSADRDMEANNRGGGVRARARAAWAACPGFTFSRLALPPRGSVRVAHLRCGGLAVRRSAGCGRMSSLV
jgi:hypothetical protein